MFKCLFRAGPKLSLAYLRLSIAAKKTGLEPDFKHLCNRIMFCLTIAPITELSSTTSFGSNSIAYVAAD
jgi:hypothetical protein